MVVVLDRRPRSFLAHRGESAPTKEVPVAKLAELRREVDVRMRRGDSFSTIEVDVIEPSRLSEEAKSALWLYGWSFVSHDAQRRQAHAYLAALGNGY